MKSEKILAIIPARGGSKRIPRKNIKDFLGQPIIKYSIEAAIKSRCFDELMVSTDDKEIAGIAAKFGAKVPFFRSAKNSDDNATTAEVIAEVISEYRKRGMIFDYVCCLYATAPFVTTEKILMAKKLLESSGADCVLPVTKFGFPIQRSFKIDSNGYLKLNWPKNITVRSQDLEPMYHDAGQFYFLKVIGFLKFKRMFPQDTKPLIVPESEVQDIDNEVDWKIAELKYKMFVSYSKNG
jgi:N-acylneuraminate cytidylyltransferase